MDGRTHMENLLGEFLQFIFASAPKIVEPGYRSRYSDWLRAGRSRGRGLCPGKVKNFLFSTSSRPALGSTQPPIQWVRGALSPGIERSGCEADNSSPTSVKKMWIYTSSPPYSFMCSA
jgi:hypothetical protein